MSAPPRILPLGDRALVIELGDELLPSINARVRALARCVRAVPGVSDAVPTLRSALVVFDPLSADLDVLAERIEDAVLALPDADETAGRLVEVPVVYGGGSGPDLEVLAELCGLPPAALIREHAAIEYVVYMLGFTPGYPYLGLLPQTLRAPRLSSPRLRVPAGSVAIADALTGIYPLTSPGGWRLIGRTPLRIYDPRAAEPILFRPGDRVRFIPVPSAQFPDPAPEAPLLPRPSHPVIEVRKAGLYTTVQDLGRPGHQSLGLPPSGAVDPLALRVANAAVGNEPGAAALEIAAPGPVLRVLDDARVAIAGADLSASLDGAAAERGRSIAVRRGQTIEFGAPRAGVWAYVAVAGGIDVPTVLGSASTYVPGLLGGAGGRRLREGDVLGSGTSRGAGRALRHDDLVPMPGRAVTIRVIPGPQDDWLTEEARASFRNEAYAVSVHSDRAGIRLDGPPLQHRITGDFLSDGLLPGAVQVPSGGGPIVIMPDGPATGGYPKVGVVITADLRLVAQSRPGTKLRFKPVTMDEAVDALRREAAQLAGITDRG